MKAVANAEYRLYGRWNSQGVEIRQERNCGESNNLSEMGLESGGLRRFSTPFAPTLDKSLIQNPCRPG
jgi:hypothetical protein